MARKNNCFDKLEDSWEAWHIGDSEFKGYCKAKFEAITEKFKEFDKNTERVDILKTDVAGIKIFAGAFGALMGIIGSIFVVLVNWIVNR